MVNWCSLKISDLIGTQIIAQMSTAKSVMLERRGYQCSLKTPQLLTGCNKEVWSLCFKRGYQCLLNLFNLSYLKLKLEPLGWGAQGTKSLIEAQKSTLNIVWANQGSKELIWAHCDSKRRGYQCSLKTLELTGAQISPAKFVIIKRKGSPVLKFFIIAQMSPTKFVMFKRRGYQCYFQTSELTGLLGEYT